MRYAIIENDVVTNVAVADEPLAANWVASETAGIGDLYDEGEGTFTPPDPVAESLRILTRLQFRNRFTTPEKIAIYTAAESSVQIRIFLDDVSTAEEIRLDHPETVFGVQQLEAFGLLGAGRAAEILA